MVPSWAPVISAISSSEKSSTKCNSSVERCARGSWFNCAMNCEASSFRTISSPGLSAHSTGGIAQLVDDRFTPPVLAPSLDALLVGDAEKPTAKLLVLSQSIDVTNGADEGLLNKVETRLFITNQFMHIREHRKLVTPKQRVPRGQHPQPGIGNGQRFRGRHSEHSIGRMQTISKSSFVPHFFPACFGRPPVTG